MPLLEDPFTGPPPTSAGAQKFINACTEAHLQETQLRSDSDAASKAGVQPPVLRVSKFSAAFSKEVDSGIPSLETPNGHFTSYCSSISSLSPFSSPYSMRSSTTSAAGTLLSSPAAGKALSSSATSVPSGHGFVPPFNDHHLSFIHHQFQMSQDHAPAIACLFVGNLPASFTDYQLAVVLLEKFGEFARFAPCFVRVNRKYTRENVKPTALVQFGHMADACLALCDVGRRLGGRTMRVDISRADRTLDLLCIDGQLPGAQPLWLAFIQIAGIEEIGLHLAKHGVGVRFVSYGGFVRATRAVRSGYLSRYLKIVN